MKKKLETGHIQMWTWQNEMRAREKMQYKLEILFSRDREYVYIKRVLEAVDRWTTVIYTYYNWDREKNNGFLGFLVSKPIGEQQQQKKWTMNKTKHKKKQNHL